MVLYSFLSKYLALLKTAICSKETVEKWSMYTLYKVRVKLMYTLYNDLTIFSKKWLKSGLLQFLTMWILWDRKCEYGFFHITHAKNSSNHSSLTRDLTRFLGICDVEKAILPFSPHSIRSFLISTNVLVIVLFICSTKCIRISRNK